MCVLKGRGFVSRNDNVIEEFDIDRFEYRSLCFPLDKFLWQVSEYLNKSKCGGREELDCG